MKTFIKDKDGNKVILHNDGIHLKLKGDPQLRKIFTFNSGRITRMVPPRNIMLQKQVKGGMIGFNYHALTLIATSELLSKKPILLLIGKDRYEVSADDILAKKEFLHFKSEGAELQCFYAINDMAHIKRG
ncbi:MAG: hypothetical protein H8D23_11680 [Candidatus Brocadiales bacterium]|nr:hypothetical protein [Candidatus Brocadiales bacterium]